MRSVCLCCIRDSQSDWSWNSPFTEGRQHHGDGQSQIAQQMGYHFKVRAFLCCGFVAALSCLQLELPIPSPHPPPSPAPLSILAIRDYCQFLPTVPCFWYRMVVRAECQCCGRCQLPNSTDPVKNYQDMLWQSQVMQAYCIKVKAFISVLVSDLNWSVALCAERCAQSWSFTLGVVWCVLCCACTCRRRRSTTAASRAKWTARVRSPNVALRLCSSLGSARGPAVWSVVHIARVALLAAPGLILRPQQTSLHTNDLMRRT